MASTSTNVTKSIGSLRIRTSSDVVVISVTESEVPRLFLVLLRLVSPDLRLLPDRLPRPETDPWALQSSHRVYTVSPRVGSGVVPAPD